VRKNACFGLAFFGAKNLRREGGANRSADNAATRLADAEVPLCQVAICRLQKHEKGRRQQRDDGQFQTRSTAEEERLLKLR
jgi:hypothetical protein